MTTGHLMRFIAAVALATLAGCGNGSKGGAADMATAQNPDLAPAGCVMSPVTPTEILNACTDAQSGEATKDAPYFPSLAPGGTLPALP
ncbi:MAG: hypothetical protein JWN44_2705 [Myxococcales bacterium]|nr:hypothetical protein [Myxococcales bacterium]